jgi:hypothetical protein
MTTPPSVPAPVGPRTVDPAGAAPAADRAAAPAPAFTAYEYASVRAPREFDSLYRDTYEAFGWSVENEQSVAPGQVGAVTLKLRRDRRIRNRQMVQSLQRRAEGSLSAIVRLERSKRTLAMSVAILVGIIGCGFLAGSIFAMEGGITAGSIVLGGIGLLCWLAGFLAHVGVRTVRTTRVAPAIDREFETLYAAGERAAELLR